MSKLELNVTTLISEMTTALRGRLSATGIDDPLMIGIRTGGIWIARALHTALGITEPLGTLDISFYRDDFSRIGMNPQVKPSELPFAIEDRHIILVDDVLHTGRTIRAAMNELFDYGRPASITLVVLAERSGRELPIEAAITGSHLDLGPAEHVKLNGPEPLELAIIEAH